MKERVEALRRKVRALRYVVESYGDLGAERELQELQRELREACEKASPAVSYQLLKLAA